MRVSRYERHCKNPFQVQASCHPYHQRRARTTTDKATSSVYQNRPQKSIVGASASASLRAETPFLIELPMNRSPPDRQVGQRLEDGGRDVDGPARARGALVDDPGPRRLPALGDGDGLAAAPVVLRRRHRDDGVAVRARLPACAEPRLVVCDVAREGLRRSCCDGIAVDADGGREGAACSAEGHQDLNERRHFFGGSGILMNLWWQAPCIQVLKPVL